jgi:hypothetical protein
MNWFFQAFQADAPLLPSLAWAQLWLPLGWSVVLAWLAANAVAFGSGGRSVQMGAALAAMVWTWIPGPNGPAFWLGLAFQAPSLMLVLLCASALLLRWANPRAEPAQLPGWPLAWAGALLGWILLLDTFALFPVSVYALGNGPGVPFLVLLLVGLPWLMRGQRSGLSGATWLTALVIGLFVVTRLPRGNVWDALLDPCLWIGLQVICLRHWVRSKRPKSA